MDINQYVNYYCEPDTSREVSPVLREGTGNLPDLIRKGACFLPYDVGRIYNGKIPVTPLILDEQQTGWITFFELLEKNENTLFVVNSAARSNRGIEANGENFSMALQDQSVPYDLVTFWPINRQLDCVNLLMDYLRVIQCGPVFTIRNNYWRASKDFKE